MSSRSRRTVVAAAFALFRRDDGRGAPAFRLLLVSLSFALCALGFGVASATAEAPQVITPQVSGASYATAHVSGEVDPKGEFTEWFFEVSTDGTSWERTNVGGTLEGTGLQVVEGELEGLKPGTSYEVRLSAMNYSEFVVVSSPEPNPEFTTEALDPPTVSIDPVTTFTGTTAHFSGTINPNAPAGNPGAADVEWHFECTPECPGLQGGTVAADNSNHSVEADAKGLEPNTTYEVTLVGKNAGDPVSGGPVSFTTAAVEPVAQTMPAFVLEGNTTVQVGGLVNPRNSATTWWVEYGTTNGYGQSLPASQDAPAGSSGQLQFFARKLTGLSLDTTYHFRLTAKNTQGEVHGEDLTFTTPPPAGPPAPCPNAAFRTGPSANLPDCRAYEDVTPMNLQGSRVRSAAATEITTVAEDGEGVLWSTNAVLPGSDSTGFYDTYRSERTADGWTAAMVSPPGSLSPLRGAALEYATPNLDRTIWFVGPTTNPEDPDPIDPVLLHFDLYRGEADGSFTWLTRGTDMGPDTSYPNFVAGGASLDAEKVFFVSTRQYEPDAPEGGVYERSGQTTAVIKDENGNPFSAFGALVSADGSVVALRNGNAEYVYTEDLGHAVRVANAISVEFRAVGLSTDGSRLFLSTPESLTPDDEDSASDIYEYEVSSGNFRLLSGTSAGPGPGNGEAGVQPVLASPDGSTVYFTSTEQLDGSRGVNGVPNLYFAKGGEIHYATTIGGDEIHRPRLTGDEGKLLFESPDRLTAYDNAGHTEIYAYDASDGSVACASCRPTGEAPTGDATFGDVGAIRGADLDGEHIFFQSTDAVLPQDVNDGQEDVYEFTASSDTISLISTGQSPGPSLLIGNGADGRDVFFISVDSLRPHDKNVGVPKLYDARIDGGFAEPPPPGECEGEGCRGAGSARPADVAPTTTSFSGPGNPQHGKHKHKHKEHKHRKHRKHKHSKQGKHRGKSHKRDADRNGRTGR